ATYTNLAPGNYTLLIRGASNDGVWSTEVAELQIRILPPWWRTWWAYTLYSFLLLGAILVAFRFVKARSEWRYQLHLKELEATNERKISEMKANFFTNVSHELRT